MGLPACPAIPNTSAWTCMRTFTTTGDFVFHCDLHTSMKATVHVVTIPPPWPGPPGGGGATTPGSSGHEHSSATLALASKRIPARDRFGFRIKNADVRRHREPVGRDDQAGLADAQASYQAEGQDLQYSAKASTTVKLKLSLALCGPLQRKRKLSLRLIASVKTPAQHPAPSRSGGTAAEEGAPDQQRPTCLAVLRQASALWAVKYSNLQP